MAPATGTEHYNVYGLWNNSIMQINGASSELLGDNTNYRWFKMIFRNHIVFELIAIYLTFIPPLQSLYFKRIRDFVCGPSEEQKETQRNDRGGE